MKHKKISSNTIKMDLPELNKIKKMEAPPFLFTKIMHKIETETNNTFALKTSVSVYLTFALILLINGIALFVFTKNNAITTVANQIMYNNSLY